MIKACCFFVTVEHSHVYFIKTKATKEQNCPLLNATLAILDSSLVPSFQYFLGTKSFRGHTGVLFCFSGDLWVKLCFSREVRGKHMRNRRRRKQEKRKRRKLWCRWVIWNSCVTQKRLVARLQLNQNFKSLLDLFSSENTYQCYLWWFLRFLDKWGALPVSVYFEIRCGHVVIFFFFDQGDVTWSSLCHFSMYILKANTIICHRPFPSATAKGNATNSGCPITWTSEWRWYGAQSLPIYNGTHCNGAGQRDHTFFH